MLTPAARFARLARIVAAALLVVAFVAQGPLATARSSARRRATRALRLEGQRLQYERFVAKLKTSSDRRAGSALHALESLAKGQALDLTWTEKDIVSAGFSGSEFRLAAKHAARVGTPKLLEQVLGAFERDNRPRLSTKGQKDLLGALEGVMFWRSSGDASKVRYATKRARAVAKGLGVDIEKALAADVGYSLERRDYDGPRDSAGYNGKDKPRKIPFVALRRGRAADVIKLPAETTRQVPRNPLWWTGNQTAYVDLLKRRLPQLLVARAKQNPDKPVFRIWHAGHEDASQTFVLAAMADEAIATLTKQRPDLAPALRRMKVEIYATDLGHKVQRRGRNVSFALDRAAPLADKTPMHLALFGKGEAAKAARELRELDKGFDKLGARGRVARMQKIADVGKMAQLVGRMLEPTALMAGTLHGQFTNQFRLKSTRWRIVDGENGGTLNKRARTRVINFSLGDLTKSAPTSDVDLAVCSNVLPYLGLYDSRFDINEIKGWGNHNKVLASAVTNLVGSLRKGGALLMDVKAELHVAREAADAAKQVSRGKHLWVTRSNSIERLSYDLDNKH
ncbi:MAG: hypothetical protein KC503_10530 [Myxococcales bacterium]|nr:hypothetical protein [Myxococcales bacterium]